MDTATGEFLASIEAFDVSLIQSDDTRVLVLRAAQGLCNKLESPYETIMRLTYQDPPYRFALHIADKLSIFNHLAQKSPQTTDELASATLADSEFLVRILRHLAAKGTIVQQSRDSWAATPLSRAFADSSGSANIRALAVRAETIFGAAPDFFETHGFRSPTDGLNTVFQHAYDCPGVGMFEHMRRPENAVRWQDFNSTIAWNSRYRVSWMDICPPAALFEGLEDLATVAFIDIGGGTGADVAEVRRRFPASKMPSQVVLQEQAHVIETASKLNQEGELTGYLNEVELQVHDFWTPQTIVGAKVYYFSSVLHDWPDAQSIQILSQAVKAMKKGYSKLILNENVIPEIGCLPQLSGLDLTMMANLAAKERTEQDWEKLLTDVGLQIVEIHRIPSCTKAVIEAELKS